MGPSLFKHGFTLNWVEFILRSGRAVIYPLFKGMHEREAPPTQGPQQYRDRVIQWHKDLARSLDYIETRTDIDQARTAYFGFSRGGILGPVFTALESRFRASILLSGGFAGIGQPSETNPVTFASRVTVPTLILHGKYDFARPLEESARPMFELLATKPDEKRLAAAESGHIPPLNFVIRETLGRLDTHLGRVTKK
jgi:dipeptidyl aminopeptidase/acylaminoacyl peptidase